ncbi:MAG: DUF4234 domain-containing protein [Paludibacteraceae bacterium]|nr:DUF4234 domain-containing protein [Paludibacteraceae bacterium]
MEKEKQKKMPAVVDAAANEKVVEKTPEPPQNEHKESNNQTPVVNINLTQNNANNNSQNVPTGQGMLRTNRGLLKILLLNLITFGIYQIVVEDHISDELNMLVTRYDARRTMRFGWIFFIFSWLTLGIALIVWFHRTSDRMNFELRRRNIAYDFGAGDFWLWGIIGSLILVGPFIYIHKRMKAMNLINADYNQKG